MSACLLEEELPFFFSFPFSFFLFTFVFLVGWREVGLTHQLRRQIMDDQTRKLF